MISDLHATDELVSGEASFRRPDWVERTSWHLSTISPKESVFAETKRDVLWPSILDEPTRPRP